MPDQWYLSRGEERFGPYAWEHVVRYAKDGHISANDQLWSESTGAWRPASTFPELFPAPPPPALSPAPPPPVATPAPSSAQAGVRRRPKVLIPGVIVVLVLLAVVVTFMLTREGEGAGPVESATDAEPVFFGIPGRSVPLDLGVSLFVPDGALPEDATMRATIAEPSALPEGVTALGPTFDVSVKPLLEMPVQVRLPLPGGADPADGTLAILRTTDIGYAELLMAEIQGDQVVAYTSAFSRFTVVEFAGVSPVKLFGQQDLIPGERTNIYAARDMQTSPPGSRVRAFWSVEGAAAILSESADAVTLQAGSAPGTALLSYVCVDAARGTRWYGALPLRVVTDSPRLSNGFLVAITTDTPVVAPGEQGRVTASVHGDYVPPLEWRWDYGPGTQGPATTGPGVSEFSPPPAALRELDDQPLTIVTVYVTDSAGRQARSQTAIWVMSDPLTVELEGPSLVPWAGEPMIETYRATTSAVLDRYIWTWHISPGTAEASGTGGPDSGSGRMVKIGQPGSYRVQVTLQDGTGRTAVAAMPVDVVGGESLSTRFLDLPGVVQPGVEIVVHVQVRGGALIVAGLKQGYSVTVDWGDGSEAREPSVGADRTPDQGAALALAHAWKEPRTYTVILRARDATGKVATDTRTISVTGDQVVQPPAPAQDNRAPVAEDILTSAERGDDVAITLHGSDEDGDDLTYAVVRGPGQGTLTGEPPFLTYKPNNDITGGKDTFTYTVSDGQATSAPATVTIETGTRWVLQGGPVLNRFDARREFRGGTGDPEFFGEERFAGMFTIYSVTAGSITWEDRWVDHDYEAWNISIQCAFDAPPAVLYAGDALPLEVTFSHSGSVTEGSPGLRFQYHAGTPVGDNPLAWEDWNMRSIVDPAGPAPYYPWESGGSSAGEAAWTLSVPEGRPGEALAIQASVWNCAPCNVTWVYVAE